jgi:leader peptidase (prepilin peptidase)/N-methyltransferase
MALTELLATSTTAWLLSAATLGLVVGSFLNVVILRVPIMLENSWRRQCAEILAQAREEPENRVDHEPFNLAHPSSRCPHCGHRITALENIPVLSYLWLKGRCSACRERISIRYPLVELSSGALAALVAWHFGFGFPAIAALLLTWGLIALSVIDSDHQLLPDSITLPFLWLGLLLSLFGLFTTPAYSIIGAAAGYISLWGVYHLFRWLTGKEGLGYGDFKLFALLGAWLGWQALPLIILLASLTGAILGATMIIARGRNRDLPIPFGPYLAAAGWITLLWGEELVGTYFRWSGIS